MFQELRDLYCWRAIIELARPLSGSATMKRPTSLSLFVDISGVYREGCAAFASVSPNVVADESVMKTDEGMTIEQRYTVVGLSCLFMHCIICLNWDL